MRPEWLLAGAIVATVVAAAALVVGLALARGRRARYHRHKGLPPLEHGLQALWAEARAVATLGWFFVRGFWRDTLRVPQQVQGRPVLCVHGYTQNATNFWGLRRMLEARGRPTVAISLRHRLAPLPRYAARLEGALEALVERFPDEGVDVVAHSMGGVVLRLVLDNRPDLAGAVRHVVTLGSPHHGTAAARGIPLLPEVRALKRSSEALQHLPDLPALLPHGRVTTVAGEQDAVVYPTETCHVVGAEHLDLPGVGHAGLLTDRRAWSAVLQALDARGGS